MGIGEEVKVTSIELVCVSFENKSFVVRSIDERSSILPFFLRASKVYESDSLTFLFICSLRVHVDLEQGVLLSPLLRCQTSIPCERQPPMAVRFINPLSTFSSVLLCFLNLIDQMEFVDRKISFVA